MLLNILSLMTAFRLVVIPVQFKDKDMERVPSQLESLTASAESYFNRQFAGNRTFSFSITAPVRLSRDEAYYGANYPDRRDALLGDMVREAVREASGTVDFRQYVNASNQTVDHIMFICAGHGEDDGDGENSIYPQTSNLSEHGGAINIQGCKIDSFSVCGEYSTGVFCHEFCHYLGLPDFYDTDGERSGGKSPGLMKTSIMDDGCKKTGVLPDFNAIELELMGLGKPSRFRNGDYSLGLVGTSREYLKLITGVEDEFYLMEYHKPQGIMIYHVDRSGNDAGYSDVSECNLTAKERWDLNQINCRPGMECAAIQGGGTLPASGQKIITPYPGCSFAVKNIIFSPTKVSFTIFEPLVIEEQAAFQDAAIIQWKTDADISDAKSISLSWKSKSDDTAEVTLSPDASSYTIEGLKPSTEYHVSVCLTRDEGISHTVHAVITTKPLHATSYPYIYLNGINRNTDGSFPKGTRIALRVANVKDVESIRWTINGKETGTDGSGFYTVESGILKAQINYLDGTVEYLSKQIVIR